MLARRDLVSALAQRQSGFHERRLMSATTSRYRDIATNSFWRADMDNVVLDLMRRGVLEDLQHLAWICAERQERHYIVKCFGWADVQYKHRGAVLWFDAVVPDSDTPWTDMLGGGGAGPEPYATFEIDSPASQGEQRKESLVVYNMLKLLGEEYVERLRREAKPFSSGGEIFMLAGRRTLDVQEKLWKLQGYLADHHGEPAWD